MRRVLMTTALAGVLAAASASLGVAQTAPERPARAEQARDRSSPLESPQVRGGDRQVESLRPGQIRASKLIGADVHGADDEKIGEVKEIILDSDGSADAVVVSVGGFLAMGQKNVAIPMAELKRSDRGDRWSVNRS